MKACKICERSLPLDCFPTGYTTRSGLGPYCKRCNSAKRRAWRVANRERANAQANLYAAANKELRRQWCAKYRTNNKEHISQASREHRLNNLGLFAAKAAKERATRRRARVGDDAAAVKKIYSAAASIAIIACFYCGRDTVRAERHVDHKKPLSRGGPHAASNLIIACETCNLRKGRLTAEEFAASKGAV